MVGVAGLDLRCGGGRVAALRMLFFERVPYVVKTVENDRHKIEYHAELNVDDDKADELEERYRILIS